MFHGRGCTPLRKFREDMSIAPKLINLMFEGTHDMKISSETLEVLISPKF